MAKFIINREVYFNGKRMLPKKVIMTRVMISEDGTLARCFDENGEFYIVEANKLLDDGDNPIKDARTRLGITQKQMSELFNIPKRTIENWERKKNTPSKYVEDSIIGQIFSLLE